MLTQVYMLVMCGNIMEPKNEGTWNKMVHASFKKVVTFDLICMGIGVVIGMGIGVYLIAGL